MSRKSNCWDNAVMERFFLNLKMERVWRRDYANHHEAIHDVTGYIVYFYLCPVVITASACTQHWAICYPMATNEKWQSSNLSLCPKLVAHYKDYIQPCLICHSMTMSNNRQTNHLSWCLDKLTITAVFYGHKKTQAVVGLGRLVGRLAIPYFRMANCHTIIGAKRFHFRVRDGIGWFTLAMVTKQFGVTHRL